MFYITVKLCQPKKLHILAEGAIGQFAGFPDFKLASFGLFRARWRPHWVHCRHSIE